MEQAAQARRDSERTKATAKQTRQFAPRERALSAKRRELAEHARELHRRALEELRPGAPSGPARLHRRTVAVTFELGARIRERIADRNGPEADYYRLRVAWNRTVPDFERRQAAALRNGHLLAVPWRPATSPPPLDPEGCRGNPEPGVACGPGGTRFVRLVAAARSVDTAVGQEDPCRP